MNKEILFFLVMLFASLVSPAQFAPPAGQAGSTAIHKDSSIFAGWAAGCEIVRGLQDISNPGLGYADTGDSTMALGKAGTNGVVSLGDGGYAIITFNAPVFNGPGWDFAVFENSFSDDFLELAFVEVSSDGINFFRFPATSLTQDTVQTNSFGSTDATKINNLAGKYRANYGTPFDLEELKDESGLDVNNITHIKIIDVVGSINDAYATYDQHGNKVNDPYPTAFSSSGFDLDAVGVIHQLETSVRDAVARKIQLEVFPNPVQSNSIVRFYLDDFSVPAISLFDLSGKEIFRLNKPEYIFGENAVILPEINFPAGTYILKAETGNGVGVKKIVIK